MIRRALFVLLLGLTLMGARRVEGGGCTGGGRFVEVSAGSTSASNFAGIGRTRNTAALDVGFRLTPFERFRWRADPNSFVEIFDHEMLGSNRDRDFFDGLEAANVIRVRYPLSFTSDEVHEFDVDELAAELGTRVEWQGGRSFRFYDVGECSEVLSWRDLAESLDAGLTEQLAVILPARFGVTLVPFIQEVTTQPLGNYVFTPIFKSPHSRDRFRYTQTYSFDFDVAGSASRDFSLIGTMEFEGHFEASGDGTLRFDSTRFASGRIQVPRISA